jgi:vanillate monooxygenase ferredoxin subunit
LNRLPLTVLIADKTVEAIDVCSIELADPTGRALPAFSAGSHVDVQVGDGLVRQYSLCNNPSETHRYLIAVLRDRASRGGSAQMHALQAGQLLQIGRPRNRFPLVEDARDSLLLAGGIGITPILCMAERLWAIGAPFELHYCTRSAPRTAFADRMRRSAFADRVRFHLDDGPGAQRLDRRAVVAEARAGRHLYVCGPAGFIESVLGAALDAGWPDDHLHREHFSAPSARAAGEFEVQIASTGAVIRVRPEQSVAAALSAAGIEVPIACSQGVCGTCLTRVLEGTPEHRDMFLSAEQQARGDAFTPCCSRALSARLVLDL